MKPDKMELYTIYLCEALPILTNQNILLAGLYDEQNVTRSRKSKERTKNLSIIVFSDKKFPKLLQYFFFTDYEKICYFCLH